MNKKILYIVCICILFIICGCSQKNINEKKANNIILCENYCELLCEDLVNNFNANSKFKINFEVLDSKEIKDKISKDKDYIVIGYDNYTKQNYEKKIIAKDGIAIIVNKENSLNNLKLENIKKIYNGYIKNWNELGYYNKEIVSIFFDDNVNKEFEKQIFKHNKNGNLNRNILISFDSKDINYSIIQNKDYIGFLPSMYANNNVKRVKLDGIELNNNNVASGLYTLNIPIYLSYKDELGEEFNEFIKFIESDNGKNIINKYCIQVEN